MQRDRKGRKTRRLDGETEDAGKVTECLTEESEEKIVKQKIEEREGRQDLAHGTEERLGGEMEGPGRRQDRKGAYELKE